MSKASNRYRTKFPFWIDAQHLLGPSERREHILHVDVVCSSAPCKFGAQHSIKPLTIRDGGSLVLNERYGN